MPYHSWEHIKGCWFCWINYILFGITLGMIIVDYRLGSIIFMLTFIFYMFFTFLPEIIKSSRC